MTSLRIVRDADLTDADRALLCERRGSLDGIMRDVRATIAAVRDEGDVALTRLTAEFDGVDLQTLEVSAGEFSAARQSVSPEVCEALEAEIAAVRAFHRAQMPRETVVETGPGVRAWREWRPLDSVGLYVPGGRGPYPSSVIMLGVPAGIAGCRQVILCTPPSRDGAVPAATLVAADMVGIRRVFKLGGAQAIAAMAYGTGTVPRVDKVFGAGNAYVTAAKLAVFPDCMLDVPAGPSEILIIADGSAPAEWVAADLLSTVEHGPDSPAVLVTTSPDLAQAVAAAVDLQLMDLPRREIADHALRACGLIVLVDSIEQAAALADDVAPEHLEIMADNPRGVLRRISNAGSVFLGAHSPNAAGDYATGTNHVLPTAGYARSTAAVSVESFGRLIQCQELTPAGLEGLASTVQTLAREEGLEAHARAAEIRLERRDG